MAKAAMSASNGSGGLAGKRRRSTLAKYPIGRVLLGAGTRIAALRSDRTTSSAMNKLVSVCISSI